MTDDSLSPHPTQLSDEDATFLASLLLGTPAAPSEPAVVDLTTPGELIIDLTNSSVESTDDRSGVSPNLEPGIPLGELLSSSRGTKVSDLIDGASVAAAKATPEVIARSVFGLPEPGGTRVGVRQEVGASKGASQGWFRPVADVALPAVGPALFDKPTPVPSPVVIRLESAAPQYSQDDVASVPVPQLQDQRRKLLLVALFVGAVAVGGGLSALLQNREAEQNEPVATPSTIADPSTTIGPTTAVENTVAPTTLPPTTLPPETPATTAAPPTTQVPTSASPPPTTRAPTTRAPRTTARPAPTTVAPTVTFAPPTWDDPLE